MTRINASINPAALCDQHLLAEYRELPRVIALAKNWAVTKEPKKLPEKFTLGTGHVLFFYDKLFFLYNRYVEIGHELMERRVKIDKDLYRSVISSFQDAPWVLKGDYEPTPECHLLLCTRIKERLYGMSKITYYGKAINAEQAFEKISHQGIYQD